MKITATIALLGLLLAAGPLFAQQTFPIYTGTVPDSQPSTVQESRITLANGGVRIDNVLQASLMAFLPAAGTANGTAVIICPGGGYARLSIDSEGYDVAKRLNEFGITAFVLKYRLPNDESQPDKSIAPLLDAQQALRLVRQQAAKYSINPERIGLMGFSAGGHPVAWAGTRFARPVGDDVGPASVRPAFLVLMYPVISFSDTLRHPGSRDNLLGKTLPSEQIRQYSNELHVSNQTPPAFLVHAEDDKTVPVNNSIVFHQACLRHGVPAEMHLYLKGGHGFGLNNTTTKDLWPDRLRNWLDANGWLSK